MNGRCPSTRASLTPALCSWGTWLAHPHLSSLHPLLQPHQFDQDPDLGPQLPLVLLPLQQLPLRLLRMWEPIWILGLGVPPPQCLSSLGSVCGEGVHIGLAHLIPTEQVKATVSEPHKLLSPWAGLYPVRSET